MNYRLLLNLFNRIPLGKTLAGGLFNYGMDKSPREVFGIHFSTPIGMGAGLDPNGEFYDILAKLGLCFAEIGPLTPANVRATIERIIEKKSDCVPAVNIAKSPESSLAQDITKDIVDTFSLSYEFADMFILDCRDKCFDIELINDIVTQCLEVRITYDIYKPILIGIGDSISPEDLEQVLDYAMLCGLDGVVASGAVNVRNIYEYTRGRLPIIAYGSIDSPEIAKSLLESGASLLALTTELNEKGPGYVRKILEYISK